MLKLKSLTNSEKYSLNLFSVVLTASITLISLCFIYFEVALELTNFQWGLLFTILMAIVVGLSRLNGISILSITSLFTLTIMLFLGGRFFAAIIDPTSEIFQLTYFANYKLESLESTKLFSLVIVGIFALHTGQYISKFNQFIPRYSIKVPHKHLQSMIGFAFPLFAIGIGSLAFQKIIDVLQHGYLGLYMHQAEGSYLSRISSLINTFFYIFLGIAFAYGKRSHKASYFILLCILSIIMLILGARGAFGTFILFLLWLYGNFGQRPFSILKFLAIALIAMVALNFLIELFSVRELSAGTNFIDRVHRFLYTQGITLMVFDVSINIEEYPLIPYIQSFIPGSSYIANLFTPGLHLKDISFAHYLAYTLDHNLYISGRGLGWSIFSDVYLFSMRSPLFFSFILTGIGYLLTRLEFIATKSAWTRGLLIAIIPALLFVARSSTSSVAPLIIYYTIITLFIFTYLDVWRLFLNYPNASQKRESINE